MRKFGIRAKYGIDIYWMDLSFRDAHVNISNITYIVNCPAKANKIINTLLKYKSDFRQMYWPSNLWEFTAQEIL